MSLYHSWNPKHHIKVTARLRERFGKKETEVVKTREDKLVEVILRLENERKLQELKYNKLLEEYTNLSNNLGHYAVNDRMDWQPESLLAKFQNLFSQNFQHHGNGVFIFDATLGFGILILFLYVVFVTYFAFNLIYDGDN